MTMENRDSETWGCVSKAEKPDVQWRVGVAHAAARCKETGVDARRGSGGLATEKGEPPVQTVALRSVKDR